MARQEKVEGPKALAWALTCRVAPGAAFHLIESMSVRAAGLIDNSLRHRCFFVEPSRSVRGRTSRSANG